MARPLTGLFTPRPRAEVVGVLVQRARARLTSMDDAARVSLLEDAVWQERQRLERGAAQPGERARVEHLADTLVHGTAALQIEAALQLVAAWADEIHGHFSTPAYKVATGLFPPALAALLTARPERLRDWRPQIGDRVLVDGPVDLIRTLAEEATLLLTPTHVSNLDSPVIGLALAMSRLPPFQYGAGLNLFSNPVVGWWMRRLGAYTVDRTKRAALYKDVLKDYSVCQLKTRHHGLFFPGGTRARSGAVEAKVKKGLLGTGLQAWQEMLREGRPDPEVYVIPMTLSFQLCLEANTLIDDFLAESGKQRYIISDDEFAQPRQIAAFVHRLSQLDDPIVVRFGDPIDVLGNPVPADPHARAEAAIRRRRYVTAADGTVEQDDQRDHLYTERLASRLCAIWPTLSTLMTTHVVAWVAWRMLEQRLGTRDPFRIVRAGTSERRLDTVAVLHGLDEALAAARQGASDGRWHVRLPETASATLEAALEAFRRYHRSRAVQREGDTLLVQDPRLCLYYRNRADHALRGLTLAAAGRAANLEG